MASSEALCPHSRECMSISEQLQVEIQKLKQNIQDYYEKIDIEDMPSLLADFFEKFEDELKIFEHFVIFSEYLLAFTSKFDCHDKKLVANVLYVYARFKGYYFCEDPERWASMRRSSVEEKDEIKRIVVYGVLHPEEIDSLNYSKITLEAVHRCDIELIISMVRNGFIGLPLPTVSVDLNRIASNFHQWLCYTRIQFNKAYEGLNSCMYVRRYLSLCESSDSRKCLVLWTMDLIVSHQYRDGLSKGFDSIFPHEHFLKKVEILNLLSKCMSESRISLKDIRIFCDLFFHVPIPSILFESVLETFTTLFPKSTELYQPRSLLDLVRIAVKNCAPKDATLPGYLSKLAIPASVRDFVSFKDRQNIYVNTPDCLREHCNMSNIG